MKEPSYRIENGRKIYSLECRVDAHRRPAPPTLPPRDINQSAVSNSEAEPGASARPVPPPEAEDPDYVVVHMRMISADDAYPTMGWLGPQRVRYGHDGARAIGQIPKHMAGRTRPVPLMWNHTYDVEKKAGKVANGYWEDSKDIKPGVNAWTVVNRQYDPKAAMGLETGEIDATSVSIWMDMERSHPDMPFDQFVDAAAAGEEINGEPVAWLPYNLKDVLHHAMVWSGADANSGPRAIMNEAKMVAPGHPTNTASAGTIKLEGGIMEEKALQILNSLCKELGFDMTLSEGIAPDELQAKLVKRANALILGTTRYGELEARLSRMAETYLPADNKIQGPLAILDALGPKLELAVHGEKYLSDLRAQALKAFDGANVDPDKPEMSLSAKTIRKSIEASQDTEILRAWITEYEGRKADRFGTSRDLHGTADEELPPVIPNEQMTAEERKIHASFQRWQGGAK